MWSKKESILEISGFLKSFLDFRSVDPLVSVKNPGAGFYDEAWHKERKGQGSKEFKTWRAFSLEHLGNGA